MWPFSSGKNRKQVAEAFTRQQPELCKRMMKVLDKMGPTFHQAAIATDKGRDDKARRQVDAEVMVLILHLIERELDTRSGGTREPGLVESLISSVSQVMAERLGDSLLAEKFRQEFRTLYTNRQKQYLQYKEVYSRSKGASDGTLVMGFSKGMASTFSNKNAIAVSVIATGAADLVKTVQHHLDELRIYAS